jgi:hypothetical protein
VRRGVLFLKIIETECAGGRADEEDEEGLFHGFVGWIFDRCMRDRFCSKLESSPVGAIDLYSPRCPGPPR